MLYIIKDFFQYIFTFYIQQMRNFVRNIIDFKRYQELNFYAGFTIDDYKHLNGYREGLPEYIRDNIELKRFG